MIGFHRIIPQLMLQPLTQTSEMRKRAITGGMEQKETRFGNWKGRGKRNLRGSDLNFIELVSLNTNERHETKGVDEKEK